MGEWTFSDRENRRSEEGTDFFSNSFNTSIDRNITQNLTASLNGGVDLISFTSTDSNDLEERSTSDLDRTEYNTSFALDYVYSEKLSMKGSIGADFLRSR